MPAKIRVTAIQRLCVNDGPGVRTVVFLKGCYLECPWCCNPEAIHYDADEYFDKGTCKYPVENAICRNCELYGGKSLKTHCPFNSFEKTYEDYEVDELYDLLMRDEQLFRENGGVTFSGGEPLLQSMAIFPLLQKLKKAQIHISFETTLYAPHSNYDAVKDLVDFWIVDLKFQYGYILNKDYSLGQEPFESNLRDLHNRGAKVIHRMVVMTEILDKKDDIMDRLIKYNIDQIELLPCHALAEYKYKELHKQFQRFLTPAEDDIKNFSDFMKKSGIIAISLSL